MRRQLALFLLLVGTAACSGSTIVETPSPAVSPAEILLEDVGIETLGGVFTTLLSSGCSIPCSGTWVFSTAEDEQPEIMVSVYRSKSRLMKDATRLGTYTIQGLPSLSRGEPRIAVTLTVLSRGVELTATDERTNRPLPIAHRAP
jgi:molecular chaperone DnaK (HSP70)